MTNIIWGYGGEDIVSRHAESFCYEEIKSRIINPSVKGHNLKFEEPINVLTSNHFTRTKHDMRILFPELNMRSDFYELVSNNAIKNLFFFCHDHSDIFVLEEAISLSVFKAVITPWPAIHANASKINLFSCDMAFKNENEFNNVLIERKAVWFVSNIKHNISQYGIKLFAQEIGKMVANCDVSIKLPEYGKDGKQLEDELKNLGIDVIPAELSSEHILLGSEIVISSSLSGIASLASYYNRPTIAILNNHPGEKQDPYSFIEKNTMWLDDISIVNNNKQLKKELSKKNKTKLKKHICGVFRDDFIEKYHNELFT